MVFKTKKELKNYLMSKMQDSIKEAQQKVYDVLYEFIDQFYQEFSPEEYQRIFHLYKSLMKSEIIESGKTYKAVVYFDASQMDHQVLDGYYGEAREPSEWSEEQILHTALIGEHPHGGYSKAPGQGILINGMPVIKEEALQWLINALQQNGIPIKYK